MTVLREVLARFGIDVDSSGLDGLDAGIGGVVGKLKGLGQALAGGFAVNAVKNFVMQMTNLGDEIQTSADRLGISARALQEWRHAAKLSDLEAGELDNALRFLQRNSFEAAQGGQEMSRAFRDLGVNVKGSNGEIRTIEEMLPELAEGFKNLQSPSERTGLAMRIFGRSGQALVPLLSRGAEGVAELRAEFSELGGGASQDFLQLAGDLDNQMHRLDLAMFSLKARIATALIPIFERMATSTLEFVTGFKRLADNSHIIQATLVTLGAIAIGFGIKFAIGFAGPIAIAAVFAVAIGFIILLVDDLITLFAGGKSVIGGFIDEMFGAGTAAELVAELKDAWEGLLLTVRDTHDAVRRFFGEDVPERAPRSGRASNDADAIAQRQAQAAALRGQVVRNPGETVEQARARFLEARGGLPGSSPITQLDTTAIEGRSRRSAPVRGRVSVPAGQARGGASVDARTNAQVIVQGNPDRRSIQQINSAVGEALNRRNREIENSLTQEATEE